MLSEERARRDQVLTVALLEVAQGDGPAPARSAAGRLLHDAAPWALDVGAATAALRPAKVDDRGWEVFRAWSSWQSPIPLQRLASDIGVSAQRAGRIAHRIDELVRANLQTSPATLRWLVATLQCRLGPVTSGSFAQAAVGRLGADAASGDLLLWLAGPYRPVPRRPGWVALDPATIVARTTSCLSADGGVRRLLDVDHELGVAGDQMATWLRTFQVTIVHDLAVSLAGPLAGAIERILDAHGRPLPISTIATLLAEGSRPTAENSVVNAVRAKQFRSSSAEKIGLLDWDAEPAEPATAPKPKWQARRSAEPPRAGMAKSPAPKDKDRSHHVGERLWLWMRIDDEVLRGTEAEVPAALVDGLGVTAGTRRTFSSRYGPVVLSHDGSRPVRGSVRAVTLAAGGCEGNTLLLGFSPGGELVVEVSRVTGHTSMPDPADTGLPLSPLLTGATS